MGTEEKLALVTVGTTKFDALIRGIDRNSFLQKLVQLGFNSVLVQEGQGDYYVQHINPSPVPGINVRYDSTGPVERLLHPLASKCKHST